MSTLIRKNGINHEIKAQMTSIQPMFLNLPGVLKNIGKGVDFSLYKEVREKHKYWLN